MNKPLLSLALILMAHAAFWCLYFLSIDVDRYVHDFIAIAAARVKDFDPGLVMDLARTQGRAALIVNAVVLSGAGVFSWVFIAAFHCRYIASRWLDVETGAAAWVSAAAWAAAFSLIGLTVSAGLFIAGGYDAVGPDPLTLLSVQSLFGVPPASPWFRLLQRVDPCALLGLLFLAGFFRKVSARSFALSLAVVSVPSVLFLAAWAALVAALGGHYLVPAIP